MLRITLICLLLSLPFGTAHAAPGDTARAAIQKLAMRIQYEPSDLVLPDIHCAITPL